MTTGVYLLTSPDGKQYVGKSWAKKGGIEQRWTSHLRDSLKIGKKGCTDLWAAIREYGWDSFKKEIIHSISFDTHGENYKNIIAETENCEIITRNLLAPNGYNRIIGFNTSGMIISDSTRQLMSARSKGENNPMFGKPRTDEVKEKLRIANTGKKCPPRSSEYRAKMSALNTGENHPFFGKKHKEETKKAIGDKIRGRMESDEARAKISKALTGLVRSDETRAKLFKKVEQWSKDGKTLIYTFDSVTGAAKQLNTSGGHISSVANKIPQHKTAGGFVWKWVKLENPFSNSK